MTTRLLATLCACGSLAAATYTEGDFGFDAEAADNWDALKALEAHFAAGGDGDTITFTNGIYNIVAVGSPGVQITGRSDWTIDGPGAVFQELTRFNTGKRGEGYIFQLSSTTNATLRMGGKGRQYGDDVTNSVSLFWLRDNNNGITIYSYGTNLYDHVRIGNWNGDNAFAYVGNTNISLSLTNQNCKYGAAFYLTHTLTVTNRSEGTADSGYASHRAVYMAAVTNFYVESWARNMNIRDAMHLITTAGYGGAHYGTEDGTVIATEGDSSHLADSGQVLVRIGSQESLAGYWETLPVTNRNIHVNLNCVETPEGWGSGNRNLMSMNAMSRAGTSGGPVVHENIRVSGLHDRTADGLVNDRYSLWIRHTADPPWMGPVDVMFTNWSSLGPSTKRTVGVDLSVKTPVTITACGSTYQIVYMSDPSIHTFTDLGACTDEAPATVNIGALGSYAYQPGLIPQSFRVYSLGHAADLDVNYNVTGTAVNGVNYEEILTTVTIPAGQTYADVVITPRDIGATEDATVTLTLQPGTGYTVLESETATITIRWSRPAGAFGGRVNLRGQAR